MYLIMKDILPVFPSAFPHLTDTTRQAVTHFLRRNAKATATRAPGEIRTRDPWFVVDANKNEDFIYQSDSWPSLIRSSLTHADNRQTIRSVLLSV